MTARVRVFSVNRGRESFDRADKQLAVLFSGPLQVADKTLDLVGHQVEGVSQITEFGTAGDFNAFREVAGGDAMSTASQLTNGMRQFVGEEESDQNRQQRSDQAYPEHLPAHVCD